MPARTTLVWACNCCSLLIFPFGMSAPMWVGILRALSACCCCCCCCCAYICMYVRLGVVWVGRCVRLGRASRVSVSVCMSGKMYVREWIPGCLQLKPVMVVLCPVLYPAGWGKVDWGARLGVCPQDAQAGRQAGGNRRRAKGRAGTTVCFMHNCWCECRKSGWWDLRAVCAFLLW